MKGRTGFSFKAGTGALRFFRLGSLLMGIPMAILPLVMAAAPGHPGSNRVPGARMPARDSARIAGIGERAREYRDRLGKGLMADSIAETAVREATATLRPDLMFLAYSAWLESVDIKEFPEKAIRYAREAERLVSADPDARQDQVFRAHANLVRAMLVRFEYDEALPHAYRLLSFTGSAGRDTDRIEASLLIGKCLEGKNRKIDAFRNYLQATSLAERAGDPERMRACYSALSAFYTGAGLFRKGVRYKLMERDLLESGQPVDSVARMWTNYDLLVISLKSESRFQEEAANDLLGFASRTGNEKMLAFALALLRTHYIETGNPDLLRGLYRRFPRELEKLKMENQGLYYRLMAFFAMSSGKTDSASLFFQRAETALQDEPNVILKANFFNRYGRFLASTGNESEAIGKFTRAIELAQSADYLEYVQAAAGSLEALYYARKDYASAYRYARLNRTLGDTIRKMAQNDQLLALEIEHEAGQRELAAAQEEQATARRHALQYTAMTILILTVFVILIMLGSLKVNAWIIRSLGFFSFIFLFEFIILLADQKIHHLTHGEPWKILLIKIGLIAILLPLHHAVEKRVIAYLLSHRLIDVGRFKLWKRNTGSQQPVDEEV